MDHSEADLFLSHSFVRLEAALIASSCMPHAPCGVTFGYLTDRCHDVAPMLASSRANPFNLAR